MSIGNRIRSARKNANLTLEDIAKAVGTSRQTIQKYETGVINNIPLDKLELIAKITNSSPIHLMGWDNVNPLSISKEMKEKTDSVILSLYDKMTEAKKNELLQYANYLLANQKNNKKGG